tara:strand:- start:54220 stop:55227 length:1008 start_codon:yes stop_codon:yes gene_type:complete
LNSQNKPQLIVWGGFWNNRTDPLRIEELNSHASVTCYFLSQALSEHFDVLQISGFDSVEAALDYPNAIGVLSCFQAGFTRLKERSPNVFSKLRTAFPGQLASVIDFVSFRRYVEDHFFTVLPPVASFKEKIKRFCSGARVHHMGWSAAPEYCYPELGTTTTVFLDHGNYGGADFTSLYVGALRGLLLDPEVPKFKAFFQGNNGIEELELGSNWFNETYDRAAKVCWLDLLAIYRICAVFCITHRESAGLGAIEAAMCGSKLIVPSDGAPFINELLLREPLDYSLADCNETSLRTALKQAILDVDERRVQRHRLLATSNSWAEAAKRIASSDFTHK